MNAIKYTTKIHQLLIAVHLCQTGTRLDKLFGYCYVSRKHSYKPHVKRLTLVRNKLFENNKNLI